MYRAAKGSARSFEKERTVAYHCCVQKNTGQLWQTAVILEAQHVANGMRNGELLKTAADAPSGLPWLSQNKGLINRGNQREDTQIVSRNHAIHR